ncbi:Serine carboxypeptidase S28 family protein [Brugia pahangi]
MNEVFFSGIEKPRWILFGDSYSGALAAWFREMNEDLTIAAIVSSGVVQAEVDYYDHTKNLEYVLKEENAPCAETIRLGMKALIEKTYTADGRAELGKVFNMCVPFTEPSISKDIQLFLASVLSLFGAFIQYAGGCRIPDVSYFCNLITHGGDTDGIGIILNTWKIHDQVFQSEECFDQSYANHLEKLSDISLVHNEFVSYRSWLWLSCTELGFFITTDNGKSIFGSSVSLDYFIDKCMDVFDVQYDAERVRDGVRNTLRTFGGYDNYRGSNTIFATGSYDPWKSACCLNCTDITRNVYSFIIEGGSHCIDTCPVNFINLPALDDYRIFLDEKIEMFIAESSTTNDSYNSKNNNSNNNNN